MLPGSLGHNAHVSNFYVGTFKILGNIVLIGIMVMVLAEKDLCVRVCGGGRGG